ncbi:MAG: anthranilate synthase component II, partial [Caulobacteraceae bacterium]
VHFLAEIGAATRVWRNDSIAAAELLALKPQGVVLSPGPCTPNEAGICLELVALAGDDLPILGVCLGHQAIGQALGGKVVAAKSIVHGKTSPIRHRGEGLFQGLPDGFSATRYHSLALEERSLPGRLKIDAWTDDGEIMAIADRDRPVFGVQFHPESIATQNGHRLLANFIGEAAAAR